MDPNLQLWITIAQLVIMGLVGVIVTALWRKFDAIDRSGQKREERLRTVEIQGATTSKAIEALEQERREMLTLIAELRGLMERGFASMESRFQGFEDRAARREQYERQERRKGGT